MYFDSGEDFLGVLSGYQAVIDADIAEYCNHVEREVGEGYGEYPLEAVKLFTSVLSRGGKRLRGALAMHSYYMCGGTDDTVALQAARVMEMLQTYMLMADDIQDRSDMRRGGPSAHIMMRDYHSAQHFADGSDHFGVSIAMCAYGFAFHDAMIQLSAIPASADKLISAMKSVNQNYAITCHGQVLDIFNEVVGEVSGQTIDNVLEWKSGRYTFISPLHFGALLAGADTKTIEFLGQYGVHAGKVFQITDDIIGVFSDEAEAGKSPLDDIKEGKRTVLSTKAMELAKAEDKEFFVSMLGNQYITTEDFMRCREIVRGCGALDYAKDYAKRELGSAKEVIASSLGGMEKRYLDFLYGILDYMIERKK
jgi:geranylgeranyl diphosphate synthase, type I